MCNGQTGSKWLDFGGNEGKPTWLEYDLLLTPDSSPCTPATSYTLTSANDFPERDPADFRLEGLVQASAVSASHAASVNPNPASDSLESTIVPQANSGMKGQAHLTVPGTPDPAHNTNKAQVAGIDHAPQLQAVGRKCTADVSPVSPQQKHLGQPGLGGSVKAHGSIRKLDPEETESQEWSEAAQHVDEAPAAALSHQVSTHAIPSEVQVLSAGSAAPLQAQPNNDSKGKCDKEAGAGTASISDDKSAEIKASGSNVMYSAQASGSRLAPTAREAQIHNVSSPLHENAQSDGNVPKAGQEWVILDEQKDVHFVNRHQPLTFQISSPRACRSASYPANAPPPPPPPPPQLRSCMIAFGVLISAR